MTFNYKDGTDSFDAIVFVASLHHMDAETALRKARELLAPSRPRCFKV